LLDAIGLHHFRWRKKKVEQFIIPPTYFRRTDYSIVEKVNGNDKIQIEKLTEPKIEISNSDVVISTEIQNPKPHPSDSELAKQTATLPEGPKISALSLSSIRAKRELLESTRGIIKETVHLPSEVFNETDMLLQWSKYAQRLGDKGHKIMESLLMIGTPKLEGTTIIHELPNEGSKIDFETELHLLLGHLKGQLHNHDITIKVVVNEAVETKFAITTQDKYNRLNEINPNLELLRKTFDLDI
jgi:DNA polymerase-3 subunit gamma/tau